MHHQPLSAKVLHHARLLITPGSSLIVGVSGGSDSVALLHLLVHLAEPLKIEKLFVAHCNHGLRGDASDGDEALVRDMADKLGLPFLIKRFGGHTNDEPGLEAWGRQERYAFFTSVCRENSCHVVATGHTLDDQAETVLMRLLRGSGINGLRGIAGKRDDGIIRPLLHLRKNELLQWLQANNIPFREDASNSGLRFFRNRVRHTLLPELTCLEPLATEHIAAIATEAQKIWAERSDEVQQWVDRWVDRRGSKRFAIKKAGLHDAWLVAEGIRQLFKTYQITPTRLHIEGVAAQRSRSSGTFLLPDGWRYRVGKEVLFFEKDVRHFCYPLPIPGSIVHRETGQCLTLSLLEQLPLELNAGRWTAFLDADAALSQEFGQFGLVYRTMLPEDEFIPLGREKKVNICQFLAKQGLNSVERELRGVVTTQQGAPVWIPGVRLAAPYRVTPATKQVIKLHSEPF